MIAYAPPVAVPQDEATPEDKNVRLNPSMYANQGRYGQLANLTAMWCGDLYNEMLQYRTLGGRTVVYANATNISTSGTGEDDLDSVVLPRFFFQRHYGLNVKAAGVKANANGNKTIKFYIGSTSVTFHPAVNDETDWVFEATILFEDYNSQRMIWDGNLPTKQYHVATEDMIASNTTLKVTGECAHASDFVTQTMFYVESF